MINHAALLARDTLRDLDQLQLHPRTNLIKSNSPSLPLLIVPPHIIIRQIHRVPIVPSNTFRRRRSAFIPTIRASLSALPQEEICDILLVSEIQELSLFGTAAFENAPYALGDAVRLDGDDEVPEIDGATVGVICDKHDTPRGREGEGVWGERREKRLERFHEKGEVGRGCWRWWRERR